MQKEFVEVKEKEWRKPCHERCPTQEDWVTCMSQDAQIINSFNYLLPFITKITMMIKMITMMNTMITMITVRITMITVMITMITVMITMYTMMIILIIMMITMITCLLYTSPSPRD